jgi:hypothetical protein
MAVALQVGASLAENCCWVPAVLGARSSKGALADLEMGGKVGEAVELEC